jgi:hypothetical protein
MESKIIKLMQLKHFVDSSALGRQLSIRDGRYTDAMTNHFLFYMYLDEYQDIKHSLTQKETNTLLSAMFCFDYRFK